MILITGTSNGIGKATAMKFVHRGLKVIGFDIQPATFSHVLYTHYQVDVSDFAQLPELPAFKVVINNAGTIDEDKAMDVNYRGYVNIVNKYCYQPELRMSHQCSIDFRTRWIRHAELCGKSRSQIGTDEASSDGFRETLQSSS